MHKRMDSPCIYAIIIAHKVDIGKLARWQNTKALKVIFITNDKLPCNKYKFAHKVLWKTFRRILINWSRVECGHDGFVCCFLPRYTIES